MKTILSSLILMVLTVSNISAQAKKIQVVQDAYTQAGNTAYSAMGVDDVKNLKIMVSDEGNKYARSTYLQFSVKKGQADFNSVTLNIHAKIFSPKVAGTKYNLDVYAVENDKWSENSITAEKCPEAGKLIQSVALESNDGVQAWIQIELDANEINALFNQKKDRKITLVLKNPTKDGMGMVLSSKDKTWSNGTDAQSASFLEVK